MLKIRNNSGQKEIWDPIRKRWVALTQEEEVRQFFIQYLINDLHINTAYISVEKQITLNGTIKRYDILVYNKSWKPWMVVECKAPGIKLTQEVIEQAGRYNNVLKAKIIAITNGNENRFFYIDFENNQIQEIAIPTADLFEN